MQQPCTDYSDSCSNVIYQTVDVGLPISLTPEVKVGKIKVSCCNEPVVACGQTNCGNCRCEIIITQTLSYIIPIEYSLESNVGDASCYCQE